MKRADEQPQSHNIFTFKRLPVYKNREEKHGGMEEVRRVITYCKIFNCGKIDFFFLLSLGSFPTMLNLNLYIFKCE